MRDRVTIDVEQLALALNNSLPFSSKLTVAAVKSGGSRRLDYINGCSLWGLLVRSQPLHGLTNTVAPSQPVS
jgi:hypothetical protein